MKKITVVTENDNVIIQPTNPEKIYVPRYPPEMLYEPGYAAQPISYYPDPYPNCLLSGATFFAAALTGVAWAAAVNWDDWGVWGGNWRGTSMSTATTASTTGISTARSNGTTSTGRMWIAAS